MKSFAVGVCDWGTGGLGFYGLLRKERPDLDVVYLGDQGVPGYGKLPRPVLAARVANVLSFFETQAVLQIVVACNAASTVLHGSPTAVGMIRPTLDHIGQGTGRIGVIGGRRTILSGAYARPLRASGWTVTNRIAQPLSGLIEAGKANADETQRELDTILSPLKNVDRLILACTHYVVLERAIRERLPNVEIIDPATLAWRRISPALPPKTHRIGTTRFLTTGNPSQMAQTALAAFDVRCDPILISLPEAK